MEKEFVPYEQAVALKELGFDKITFGYYTNDKDYPFILDVRNLKDKYKEETKAPTFSQAFRWFREKYGLWQTVLQNTDINWTYDILPIMGIHDYKLIDVFETYEEAELACLIKLIEIVKTK